MTRLVWLAALVFWAPAALADADLDRARTHAREGERLYEAGDFAAAAAEFTASLELGLDHALIHYNLGNARYKSGELGRAVASWQRALRRDPRDAAARANLAHARTLLRDEGLDRLEVPVFLRPLQWVYHRFSLDGWARLGLGAVGVLALMGILGHWGRGPRAWRRRIGWTMVGVAAIALVAGGVRYRSEVIRTQGVVVVDEVAVRSGPGEDYNLAFEVHEGLTVYVGDRRQDWIQIHLGGALVGWVPVDDLELL